MISHAGKAPLTTVGIWVKSAPEYTPFMAVLGQIFQTFSLLGNCTKSFGNIGPKILGRGGNIPVGNITI